ncbi:MAG: Crp/Fnr family transcriptional regulator [Blastocatellia bacterium]|nr:Crp/Fnr family transcriptional regulator [Blastocatellia bacterium]
MGDQLSRFTRRLMGKDPAKLTKAADETEVFGEETPRLKTGYLSAMDLFRDLTPEEMQDIDRATFMQTCKAGRVFYMPGETGEVLFILKKGAVQIYRMSPEGRKLVMAQLPPYSFFGEMSCIGQGMYDSFAEATEDSLICTMSRKDVERLILSKPQVALRLLEALGKRMVEAEQQLEELAFKGLIPRIASLLMREAKEDEVKGLSHQDLAERLGVHRESATIALNELKTAGIIEIGRKRIKIVDRKRLERAAAE